MRIYFLCFIALLLVLPASAKNDAYVEDLGTDWGGLDAPFALPAPIDWKQVHGRLGVFGDMDAFSLHFDEAVEAWNIEVRVPVCGAHFEAVYPNVALIGAGLETPEDAVLPIELEEGLGAVILQAGEHLSPRTRDNTNQFNFFYDSADGTFYTYYYYPERIAFDIPAAGDYSLLVWEPSGHVGAYMLWMGNQHPDDMGSYMNPNLERAFEMIGNGSWMAQDCNAPLNDTACPPALESLAAVPQLDFPERSEWGDSSIVLGKIYDAATCLPIAGAEIDFEMTNADGTVDESGTGTIFTNEQGAYRVASATATSSIRLYVSAEGYLAGMVEALLEADEAEPVLDISLATGS